MESIEKDNISEIVKINNFNQLDRIQNQKKIHLMFYQYDGYEKFYPEFGAELAKKLENCGDLTHFDLQVDHFSFRINSKLIITLTEGLQKCVKLTYLKLYLRYQELGIQGIQSIANLLNSCKNITYLSLALEVYNCQNEGINTITKAMQNCLNIEILKIMLNSHFSLIETQNLAGVLQQCTKIKCLKLDFQLSRIPNEGFDLLGNAIGQLKNLIKLELILYQQQRYQNYKIDLITYRIAETLKNCQNLEKLNINLNANKIGDKEITMITESIIICQKITHLVFFLRENQIKDEGVKSIAFMLQHCQKIKSLTLDLEQNELSKESGMHIAQMLQSCCNIQFMNLCLKSNGINHQQAQLIGQSIQKMQNLKDFNLNLNQNEIGLKKGKDVKIITDSLLLCQNITNLSLKMSGNFIGVEGAKNIAKLIQNCNNIRYLKVDFSYNQIGLEGVRFISKSLENQRHILHFVIKLHKTNIGINGCERIVKALAKCQHIIILNISLDFNCYQDFYRNQYIQNMGKFVKTKLIKKIEKSLRIVNLNVDLM
ncbi:hypothetical protein ABPG74_011461 [Tetrahymena malaccensis]